LRFNGKEWKNVGFRLKGNSSLRNIWSQGNFKLPFRLNFDKFEDTFPQIKNQHFYGFEELSFSPAFKDPSLLHEKLASDIFRMGGIPAPQTAFYRVYIDFGSGLKYCGVYTCVEVPEDNMIKDQFGEEKGNIYKPESRLTGFIAREFEKKNNDSIPDYTDVQSFITALNQNIRLTDPAAWRKNLESTFNVSHFLKWLAINNTMVNWDTYGSMTHNYYLYNHSTRKLTWIPWDNNEALTGSPGITKTVTPGQPTGNQSGLSLTMNEVNNSWPLIRYLVDDSVYFQTYKTELKEFVAHVFNEAKMNPVIDNYHDLISPYVIGSNGEQPGYTHISNPAAFVNSGADLKTHVTARRELVSGFLK
jgi:spore coat protein CotH